MSNEAWKKYCKNLRKNSIFATMHFFQFFSRIEFSKDVLYSMSNEPWNKYCKNLRKNSIFAYTFIFSFFFYGTSKKTQKNHRKNEPKWYVRVCKIYFRFFSKYCACICVLPFYSRKRRTQTSHQALLLIVLHMLCITSSFHCLCLILFNNFIHCFHPF